MAPTCHRHPSARWCPIAVFTHTLLFTRAMPCPWLHSLGRWSCLTLSRQARQRALSALHSSTPGTQRVICSDPWPRQMVTQGLGTIKARCEVVHSHGLLLAHCQGSAHGCAAWVRVLRHGPKGDIGVPSFRYRGWGVSVRMCTHLRGCCTGGVPGYRSRACCCGCALLPVLVTGVVRRCCAPLSAEDRSRSLHPYVLCRCPLRAAGCEPEFCSQCRRGHRSECRCR